MYEFGDGAINVETYKKKLDWCLSLGCGWFEASLRILNKGRGELSATKRYETTGEVVMSI